VTPCRTAKAGRSRPVAAKFTRGGAAKVAPPQRGRTPWRAESPGELRAGRRPKQSAVGGGLSRGANPCRRGRSTEPVRRRAFRCTTRSRKTGVAQRQEGNGVGDGVRLRGRNKALEGATPRADPARNKAGRHGADESVERSRKPEDASESGEASPGRHAAAACGETLKGSKPHGRSRGAVNTSGGVFGETAAVSSENSVGEHEPKRGRLA
jgi:hypothetical protein